MQAVNLLPIELRPGPRWKTIGRGASARRVLGIAGVVAGVLALALAGSVLLQRTIVDDLRADLRDVQARLVAADAKAAAIREAQAANQARLAAVRDVVSQRIVWEDVLLDLSRVRPENVYLQGLQVDAGSATGGAFVVSGFADSQPRVAQVLDRLALLPWLSGIALQSSAGGGGGATPVSFTVAATFMTTGGGR